jgi:hypothetical protein
LTGGNDLKIQCLISASWVVDDVTVLSVAAAAFARQPPMLLPQQLQ